MCITIDCKFTSFVKLFEQVKVIYCWWIDSAALHQHSAQYLLNWIQNYLTLISKYQNNGVNLFSNEHVYMPVKNDKGLWGVATRG